jgi:hypothetical protein
VYNRKKKIYCETSFPWRRVTYTGYSLLLSGAVQSGGWCKNSRVLLNFTIKECPWRWKQQFSSKRRFPYNKLHGLTSQTTEITFRFTSNDWNSSAHFLYDAVRIRHCLLWKDSWRTMKWKALWRKWPRPTGGTAQVSAWMKRRSHEPSQLEQPVFRPLPKLPVYDTRAAPNCSDTHTATI